MEDRGWISRRGMLRAILYPPSSIRFSLRQVATVANETHHAGFHLSLVPLHLLPRHHVGFLGGLVAGRAGGIGLAEDRRADQPDPASAKVGEANGGDALVVRRLLGGGEEDVPAAKGVVGEVEVRVGDEHGRS